MSYSQATTPPFTVVEKNLRLRVASEETHPEEANMGLPVDVQENDNNQAIVLINEAERDGMSLFHSDENDDVIANSNPNDSSDETPASNPSRSTTIQSPKDEDDVVEIDAGDEEAKDASAETIELLHATKDLVPKLIANVDKLVQELAEKRKEPEMWITRRIFGDPFHLMDRVKVPVHHTSTFNTLRRESSGLSPLPCVCTFE